MAILPISLGTIARGISLANRISKQYKQNPIEIAMDLAKKLGGFSDNFGRIEDLALWLEMGKFGKFHNSNKTYLAHRLTGFNIGETGRREQIKSVIKHIKKYKKNYPNYWLGVVKLNLEYFSFEMPVPFIKLIRKIKHDVLSLDF